MISLFHGTLSRGIFTWREISLLITSAQAAFCKKTAQTVMLQRMLEYSYPWNASIDMFLWMTCTQPCLWMVEKKFVQLLLTLSLTNPNEFLFNLHFLFFFSFFETGYEKVYEKGVKRKYTSAMYDCL